MVRKNKMFTTVDRIAIVAIIFFLGYMISLSGSKKSSFMTSLQLNSIAEIIEVDYKTADSFEGLHMQGISDTGILMDSDNPYNNRFDHPEGGSLFIDVVDFKGDADAILFTLRDYPSTLCEPLIGATKSRFSEIYVEKVKVKQSGVPLDEKAMGEACGTLSDNTQKTVNIRLILEKAQPTELRPHIINASL